MAIVDKEINDLSYKIIGCAYRVHKELGPGLLESTYEACLCYELEKENLFFEKQKELPVIYMNQKLDCGYRIDILVENKVIIELKSVDQLLPIHTAQVMSYLKLSKLHLGLLINFNQTNLQHGIRRYVL
ncbi:GxxExxY protein [Bacteroides sp. 224]|uniref:GxxExxY protein n=1 Tax=Bacteroides sp. 224 TaxID=2302936 RepID=UPI0013D2830B|nr:GxxExxY protein [Bacteroides sp. 224]NDV64086.1 GxxExxY protein [Bacteroides sp. 224]